jgi:hypothetical protein
MILHYFQVYSNGIKRIMVHTTDADALVLVIVTAISMEDCELWLAFGHYAHFWYILEHISLPMSLVTITTETSHLCTLYQDLTRCLHWTLSVRRPLGKFGNHFQNHWSISMAVYYSQWSYRSWPEGTWNWKICGSAVLSHVRTHWCKWSQRVFLLL